MHSVWTDEEREYVRGNCSDMTDAAIATELTRITGRSVSIQAARKQRQKMGLRKKHGRGVCELASPLSIVKGRPKGLPLRITATE